MSYSLIELIEMITKLIGDREIQFIQKYAEEGFTARQIEYIDTISHLGHPTLGELALTLKLSKPSVTAIVDKLTDKGYVEKCQSDEDKRSFHVHLSTKGKKLVKMHNETHQRIADLFIQQLNERDLKALVALLNKVVSKA